MKVYLIVNFYYKNEKLHCQDVLKVFDSKEKAEAYLDNIYQSEDDSYTIKDMVVE